MPDEEPRKAIGASETGDKIDRIRDILLGGSLEEFGTRLGHVENLVQALDSSLREEIERRFDERVRAESELRQKLSDEVGAVRRELEKIRVELQSVLKEGLAELDANKVDSAVLARILSEASLRLRGELAPADRESRSDG